jgi:hypothetical protein
LIRFPLRLLAGLALLAAACAPVASPTPPAALPAVAALDLHSVAVAPVAYAVELPGGACNAYVVENLQASLQQKLRRSGSQSVNSGRSVPRPQSLELPPSPGVVPVDVQFLPHGAEALLLIWLEEYWENSLCEWTSPKYLTVGAVGVLYAGVPPVEVWRARARVDGIGSYQARELISKTTNRLADLLLKDWPVVPA